jgi:hypothetical protein
MKSGLLFFLALTFLAEVGAAPWTNIGPFGGEARSLASDASGNTEYVLNGRTGVFRSSGGAPWTLVFDAIARGVTPTRVTVDPQTSRVYVGTTTGLYRSDNSGLTWQALATDPIIDVTAAGDRVIISTPTGLSRSGDAGVTWTSTASPESDVETVVTVVRLENRTFGRAAAIIAGNLFISDDLGNSWQKLNAANIVAATFADALYAGGSSGVYFCNDTCERISTDSVVDVAYWRGLLYGALSDGVLVYASPVQRLIEGFPNAAMLSLLGTPPALLAGTTAGVYSTTDGTRWTNRSEGLANVRITGIAFAGGTLFASTAGQGVMRRDGTWTNSDIGLPADPPASPIARVLASDGTTLYAGFLGQGLFRSTNLTTMWNDISSGLPSRDVLDVAADAGGVVVATGGGVVRSTDRGASWQTFKTFPGSGSTAVAIKGQIIAIGSVSTVYVSKDGGTTWQTKELPASIRKLVIAGTRVVAATDQGVFVSTDTGWIGPTFAGSSVNAITATGSRMFASIAAPSGIYFSDDGMTWMLIAGSDALPKDVTVLSADTAFLYAGTNGGSIFATANPHSTRRRAVGR